MPPTEGPADHPMGNFRVTCDNAIGDISIESGNIERHLGYDQTALRGDGFHKIRIPQVADAPARIEDRAGAGRGRHKGERRPGPLSNRYLAVTDESGRGFGQRLPFISQPGHTKDPRNSENEQ